jgi:hypothetical protein
MKYFVTIQKAFTDWVEASNEDEAVDIALDKFEDDMDMDISVELEEEDF